MRTLRNLFGRKQLDSRLRSRSGNRLQFKPGIEPLEERQLLSVSSLLDAGPAESTIRNAGETVDLSLTVDAAASSVRIGFVIESTDGSLDPGIPSFISDATGNPIEPTSIQSALADANGGTGSIVVLDLAPGSYTVVAHGDGDTVGGFTADVFLPGDLDGDNAISYMDRLYAEAAAIQASGYSWNIDTAQIFAREGIDLNVPQYQPQMDANGDGLMTDFDLFAVRANQDLGEINVELIADQDPPEVDVQRADGQAWSEQNGSFYTPTPGLKVTVTDESVILGFQIGYQDAFIDYLVEAGQNSDPFELDVNALEALGLPKVNNTIQDGTYTLQFTGIDEHGNEYTEADPFLFTFTLLADNSAPIAADDSAGTDQSTPIEASDDINVLDNDSDPDSGNGDAIQVTDVLNFNPSWGSVNITPDGVLTFTPLEETFDYLGDGESDDIVFQYEISDGLGLTASANVTITIDGVNDAPEATLPTISPVANVLADSTGILLNTLILDNFTDPDTNDVLSIQSITPANGRVVESGGNWTYFPNGDFDSLVAGATILDSFVVTVQDPLGLTAQTSLDVVVEGVNDAPEAVLDVIMDGNGTVRINEDDGPIDLTAILLNNDSDPDTDGGRESLPADTLTIVSKTDPGPGNGIVSLNNGVLTFDPNGDFEGLAVGESRDVTFTYTAADRAVGGLDDTADVTITVYGENDSPTAVDDGIVPTIDTDEDTPIVLSNLLDNDTDLDASDVLTILSTDLTSTHGAAVVLNSNGTVSYDPTGSATIQALTDGAALTDTFTYTVEDGSNATSTATVTISLTGVNDPVEIVDNLPGDPLDQEFSIAAVADDAITGPLGIGTVAITDDDSGDTYEFLITGGTLSPGAPTVDLNNIVIDPLTGEISVTTAATLPNTGVEYSITLDISVVETGVAGAVADTGQVIINVVPNEPPTVPNLSVNADEKTGVVIPAADQLAGVTDPDSPTPTLKFIFDGTWLPATGGGQYRFESDGTITYDPNGIFDALGVNDTAIDAVTIPFQVEDTSGNVTEATVTITIDGVNDPPVAVNDGPFAVNEDTSDTFNIFTNDTDPDSLLTLQDSTITTTEGVVLTIDVNGNFVYDASDTQFQGLVAGETLQDTFTYTLEDPDEPGVTSEATVTITVTGVNDPVEIVDNLPGDPLDQTFSVASVADDSIGSPLSLGTVAITDDDSGDVHTFSITGGTLSPGAPAVDLNNIVINPLTGELTVIAVDTLINSADEYTITLDVSVIENGVAGAVEDTGQVEIVVEPNQSPVVADLSVNAGEESGTVITPNDLISSRPNDVYDPEGDAISLRYTAGDWLSPLTGGGLYRIEPDGSITYDPNGEYNALPAGGQAVDAVTIPFQVQDVHGNFTQATVTITITGVNDPPTAVNDGPLAVDANGTLTGENVLTNDTDPDTGDLLKVLVPFGTTSTTVTTDEGIQVTLNDDGTFTYNPGDTFLALDASESAIDSFTYQAVDPQTVVSNEATVTITINGVNDPPTVIAPIPDQTITVGQSPTTGAAIVDLSQYVNDPEGDPIGYSVSFDDATPADDFFTITTNGGLISINSNAYAADQDWSSVEVTVTVTGIASPLTFDVMTEQEVSTGLYLVVVQTPTANPTSSTLPTSDAAVSGEYSVEVWLRDWLDGTEFLETLPVQSFGADLMWTGGGTEAGGMSFAFDTGIYNQPTGFPFPLAYPPTTFDGKADLGALFDTVEAVGRDEFQRLGTFTVNPTTSAVGQDFWLAMPTKVGFEDVPLARDGNTIDESQRTGDATFVSDIVSVNVTATPPLHAVQSQNTTLPAGAYLAVVGPDDALTAAERAEEAPASSGAIGEWDGHWVEVWVAASETDEIVRASVDMAYAADYFTATDVQFASGFTPVGNVLIDDALGVVENIVGQVKDGAITGDGLVLLGRVKFESLAQDDVPFAMAEDALGLGVQLTSVTLGKATGEDVDATMGPAPGTELWANPYDTNDNQRVEVLDMLSFLDTFGSDLESLGAEAWASDYNRSGNVEVLDLLSFLDNVGLSKENGDRAILPDNFMRNWSGAAPDMVGDASLSDLFSTAVDAWSEGLNLDQPIEVDLVVRDLADGQLGAAKILDVDESGLPSRAVLTIDQDAAGWGWYAGTNGETPEDKYDLYTTLLHELGHAYGYTQSFSGFASLTVGTPDGGLQFESPAVTVPLDATGEHAAAPESIMSAELSPGESKHITWTETLTIMTSYASADPNATIEGSSASLWGTSIRSTETQVADSIAAPVSSPMADVTSPVSNAILSSPIQHRQLSDSDSDELTDSQRDELYRNGIAVHRTADHSEHVLHNARRARMLAWQSWGSDATETEEDSDTFETEVDESLGTDAIMSNWGDNT